MSSSNLQGFQPLDLSLLHQEETPKEKSKEKSQKTYHMPAFQAEGRALRPKKKNLAEEFAGASFHQESTLLTNAEKYSKEIREAAEKLFKKAQEEAKALNSMAQKQRRSAEEERKKAQKEAQETLQKAQKEAEKIKKDAQKEGLQAGMEEGLKKRYEEAGESLKHLENIFSQMKNFQLWVAHWAEEDALKLALLLARKLLLQELQTNKDAAKKLLQETLKEFHAKGNFKVWLSPKDFSFMTQGHPEMQEFLETQEGHFSLAPKETLAQGSFILENDREVIDRTFKTLFQRIEKKLYQNLERKEPEEQPLQQPSPQEAKAEK